MDKIPSEVISFLDLVKTLELNFDDSEIGEVKFKSVNQLQTSLVTLFPGSQDIDLDDPYQKFDGLYEVEVIDLIEDAEDYDPSGLFCWIPKLGTFATVDDDHGNVLPFYEFILEDFAQRPFHYLDAGWEWDLSEHCLIPWLHFPFKFSDENLRLEPYKEQCSVHGKILTKNKSGFTDVEKLLQARYFDEWLQNKSSFPFSAVPISEQESLKCEDCFKAERKWLDDRDKLDETAEVFVNEHGFVTCPFCSTSFFAKSKMHYANGRHMLCGQKLSLKS